MTSQLTLDLWAAIPEADKEFLNMDDARGYRMHGEFHVRIEGWSHVTTDIEVKLQYYRERDDWTLTVKDWEKNNLRQLVDMRKGAGALLWLFLCGYALPREEVDGGEVLNRVPDQFEKDFLKEGDEK